MWLPKRRKEILYYYVLLLLPPHKLYFQSINFSTTTNFYCLLWLSDLYTFLWTIHDMNHIIQMQKNYHKSF